MRSTRTATDRWPHTVACTEVTAADPRTSSVDPAETESRTAVRAAGLTVTRIVPSSGVAIANVRERAVAAAATRPDRASVVVRVHGAATSCSIAVSAAVSG